MLASNQVLTMLNQRRDSIGRCKCRADLGPNLDDEELASESGKLYLLISHKVCHTQYISHGMNKVVGGVV